MRIDKSTTKLIGVILTGALLFSGCGILPKEEQTLAPPLVKPKKQEYELFNVKKKDITREIKGNGSLVSVNENNLFTKENGKRVKAVKVEFGQNVKKADVLIELDSDNLENEIKLQQLNIQKAQINYDRASQGTDEYNKKLASIDLQMEKTKLENLQKQMGASKLTASVDGKVVLLESLKEGDMIEPYKPLVTIADPSRLQVVYQASDTSRIVNGMKAALSFAGKKYEGVVAQLPTSGKYKDSIVLNFKEPFKEGQLGDGVEVTITLETKKDTLVVPKAAVKSFMGNNTVEVLEGDKKLSINIEKGIETSTEVEILSGLKEGQQVILN